MNRREFLKLISVSGGAAALSACDPAVPTKLVSPVQPPDTLPGQDKLVRALCTECPAGCGVIAKVRDGQPIKLEGDPAAINRGALCMRGQAALQRVYHRERLRSPLLRGKPVTWDEAFTVLEAELAKPGPHVFLSSRTTGELSALVGDFCAKRGLQRAPEFEPISYAAIRRANQAVFGLADLPHYDVKSADFLLTVGADVIETFPNPVQFARGLAETPLRWVHVEPHVSLTGINADERLVVRAGSEAWLLAHLAGHASAGDAAKETGLKLARVEALAREHRAAKKPLVIAGGVATGGEQGQLVATLAALLQKEAPLDWGRPFGFDRVGRAELPDTIGVLFIQNADPFAFEPKLADKKAGFRVGTGQLMNATLRKCDLVLPLTHTLEEVGALKPTGTLTLAQVLTKLGASNVAAKPLPTPSYRQVKVESPKPVAAGPVLAITPSVRTYDGRGEVLPLLSEIPDPLTAISYGAWVTVSPDLRAKDGQMIALKVAGQTLQLPARVLPGQLGGVFTVQRPFLKGFALPGEDATLLPVTAVEVLPNMMQLPVLSGSMNPEGRGIVPGIEQGHGHDHKHEHPKATLYAPHGHDKYRWAMAIDLDRCTGCGACVAACYVENNVPAVGRDEHLAGREMSWIRVEPFANGAGQYEMLVMLCQHCDNAPCEPVCPVLATYHNPEGLNAQVYNRCVGTRYCSNNCPYKVRRFNWLDHAAQEPLSLMLNPDVSKRPKGVMEKCTFCIQRIVRAKDHAKAEGRLVRDGEVTTACAQTCPAQAIVFGNALDANSRVAALARSERQYRVLEELGTEPAVYYLKANPHPNPLPQTTRERESNLVPSPPPFGGEGQDEGARPA